MPTIIKNTTVFEEKDEMRISFQCVDSDNQDITKQVFNEIAKHAIEAIESKTPFTPTEEKAWLNVHGDFDVRLTQQDAQYQIEIREKNNPPGRYGTAVTLNVVPAEFKNWDIIDARQAEQLENEIRQSATAMKRKQNSDNASHHRENSFRR